MVITAADVWGIGSFEFSFVYFALAILAFAGSRWQLRMVVGPAERGSDPHPDLSAYQLAMLSGGPQLAITTAAAKLRQAGYLGEGPQPRTLATVGQLQGSADPLEREVFAVVHRSPYIATDDMRREVAEGEAIRRLTHDLTQSGLLVQEGAAKKLSGLWVFGAAIAAIGIVRLIAEFGAGEGSLFLVVLVAAVTFETFSIARRRPFATARGRALVRAQRKQRPELAHHATSAEYPYAVALWGAGAVWSTDPGFASTLGVPREGDSSWHGSGGGGACSGGGGGCSSSGGFGGGGDGGGGGGGGGGCGGGGCGGGGG